MPKIHATNKSFTRNLSRFMPKNIALTYFPCNNIRVFISQLKAHVLGRMYRTIIVFFTRICFSSLFWVFGTNETTLAKKTEDPKLQDIFIRGRRRQKCFAFLCKAKNKFSIFAGFKLGNITRITLYLTSRTVTTVKFSAAFSQFVLNFSLVFVFLWRNLLILHKFALWTCIIHHLTFQTKVFKSMQKMKSSQQILASLLHTFSPI